MNESLALNEKEAAKFLGLSVQTLRNWRFLGKPPAYSKLSKRIVYLRPVLEEFLSSNQVEPRRDRMQRGL
jgi:predicted site-specific integrase-resolvase